MSLKIKIIILFIITLAFILRFYKVSEIPPSLNWDEVSIAYNAYSILQTGRDEWGEAWPVHFKAYGEYKLPAQIYASIPGIAIFGLNELGVRITPVIYGTATVLLLFFIGRAIFQSISIGIISAFLLAVSPWHIHLTRASFESSFALFWVVLGIWFLVKGLQNSKWLIWSMIPLAISVYTYNSARVFTPLFILSFLFIFRDRIFEIKKQVLVALAVLAILFLPLIPYYLSGEGNARYKLVSVADDPGLLWRINEARGASVLPGFLPRLVHNKITYVSKTVATNYLSHFTPDFLFISGAPHRQHHVQKIGELYLFQAPFLLIGLYFMFKQRQRFRWLIGSWILLAFVPVSVTGDSIPHALRTLIVVPAFQLLTALGIYSVYNLIKKRHLVRNLYLLLIITVTTVSVALYLQNYHTVYAKLYSRDWQYGYKEAVAFVKQHEDEYDEIIFSRHYGEPHMFTLFFLGYDPVKYQDDPNLVRYETHDWVWVLRFGKYYFPDLGDKGTRFRDIAAEKPGKKLLFIGKSDDFPEEHHRLKKINFLNGDSAFDIVEIN